MRDNVFSLYLHIPYCDSKCPYCDFNSHAVKQWPEADYAAALMAEMRFRSRQGPWRDGAVATIFLGGGTPSLFAPATIAALLHAVDELWPRRVGEREITLEANPGTTTADKLRGYADAGVNRVSFGVQSFQPDHLRRLGRIHGREQAIDAVRQARAAGFANLNTDLIYAVPGQSLAEWEEDLRTAVDLGPDHISAYNLTIEEGTAFATQRRQGLLAPLAEEIEVAMFTRTREMLAAAGYAHYEISNYAPPGRECRHNLNYWRGGEYLGIGAGAHSFAQQPFPGRRWSNEMGPQAYIAAASASGDATACAETLDTAQARGEFVFLALRCREGCDQDAFAARFGIELAAAFPHAESLRRDGLLEHEGPRWRLSERGLLLADSVFATFV